MVKPSLLPKDECCGCGNCSIVCPTNIITMRPDEEGFLYPEISDLTNCISCRKCEKACPTLEYKPIKTNSETVIGTYASFLNNTVDLQKSASGGVATALSRKIVSDGGVVFGVKYINGGKKAVFSKAETIDELEAFRGSKYIQSENGKVFEEISEYINIGRSVLFIGLPCEVGALHHYLKKSYDNLITIDLICQGLTSPKIAAEYLTHLEQRFRSKISEVSVRYKHKGRWMPPYFYAQFSNGKKYLKPFYYTEYGRAFHIFSRPSCYNCQFKGNGHTSDITLGDYWGCSKEDGFYNPSGVSVVLSHTKKGDELLSHTPEIHLIQTTYEDAVKENQMFLKPRGGQIEREKFSAIYLEEGLFKAASKTTPVTRKVFDIIWGHTPYVLQTTLRNLYIVCRK